MSESPYRPAWWLPGAHAQTLWGKFVRKQVPRATRVERLETPDGDFLDLHHLDGPDAAPILVLLHGLEGTIRSHYIQALLAEATRRRWKAAVLIFRSCGGELNRTRRFYHSGDTGDIAFTLDHLLASNQQSNLLLAGFSLGGNVLLKYLGEQGRRVSPRIRGAVAVSVPFDLERSSRHIDRGFSRMYQRSFLRSLKSKVGEKLNAFPDLVPRTSIQEIETMFAFDDAFTAPVHGFVDARDYYRRSSSISWIGTISVNTLLLNSVDDPFLPLPVLEDVRSIAKSNSHLELEFTTGGGHVGFVGGRLPWKPLYYLERRTGDFLAHQLLRNQAE